MKRAVTAASMRVDPRSYPVKQGDIVFDSENPARSMYRVQQGTVKLSVQSDVILDHLAAGEFFGEKLLLSRCRSRQVATTISPVRLQRFSRRRLVERLQHDRRFASELLKSLAMRIDRYEDTIRELAIEPADRRVALLLRRLLPDRPAAGWVRIDWNPTNPELALRTGTTRWRVSRVINHFRRLGWLRRDDGLWVNREGLTGWLENS